MTLFFFFLIQDRNFILTNLSVYVYEVPSQRLESQPLSPIPNKHLYLWSKIREPALVTIGVNDVHGVYYESLKLILQWPASFCNTDLDQCSKVPNYFTIQGLLLVNFIYYLVCPKEPKLNLTKVLFVLSL